jgi:ketosteroid isomerase-like protein
MILIVQHRVRDYDTWKRVFDEHGDVRRRYGSTGHELYRGIDDPDEITVVNHFPSKEQAEAFAADPSLTEAMQRGGVISEPRITWAEQTETTGSDAGVREASARFYTALNRLTEGDAGALSDVWSHDATVTTMHPIGGRQIGWDEVRGSFDGVAQLASGGRVELRDQRILVAGDLAYEVGIEYGQAIIAGERVAIEHRVTNVYRRDAGEWKMVHHHTDISPAMLEIVGRLQAA